MQAIWQKQLKEAITDSAVLLNVLALSDDYLAGAKRAEKLFPLRVPLSFVKRMKKGDPQDPLLQQVLPLNREFEAKSNFVKDPLEEKVKNPLPGLLHKYEGRVLWMMTTVCGVNCRFCFRRHFPYTLNNPGRKGWEALIDYLKKEDSITEIILSGGDPLAASDSLLREFIQEVEKIDHVKTLRFHTRMPIVIPARITDELMDIIKKTRLQCVMVLHTNHPHEIDHEVTEAIQRLMEAKIMVLNQTVLLKNINDNPDTLIALSFKLFENRVLPYYVHQLDKVKGVSHFEVGDEKIKKIFETLQKRLPGYLVPRFVREEGGALSKILLFQTPNI